MTAGRTRRGRAPGTDPVRDRVVVVVVALVIEMLVTRRTPGFTTDSESYLDVARSLAAGHGLVQHVVDFWRPRLPEPLGLWPPLYPLTIATLTRLGATLEGAARAVSAIAYPVFGLVFLALAGEVFGAGWAALVVTLLAISTLATAFAAGMAWSEMLFLALTTAALLELVAMTGATRMSRDGPHPRIVLAAALLAGLAAVTRYIGIVLLPIGLVWLIAHRVPPRAWGAWLGLAVTPPLLWALHNFAAFGTVLGPGLPRAHAPALAILAQLLPALRWGFVPWPLEAYGVASLLFVVALLALALFALVIGGPRTLVAVYVVSYLVLLLVLRAGLTFNVIGYRYLTPVLPFLWLAAASGLVWLGERMRFAGTVARAAGVVLLVLSAFALARFVVRLPSPSPEAERRRAEMAELRALLMGSSGPVLGDAGHLVASATGRDAVEIPAAPFAARVFTADDERRWRAAGVSEVVFRAPRAAHDPEHAREDLTARYGPYLASRVAPGSRERWPVADSGATFVRFELH
jgi:hypothetical protein